MNVSKDREKTGSSGSSDVEDIEISSLPSQAVIGSKIVIKGEVNGEEDILIQGRIEGAVNFKNHTLTVGEGGKLSAAVSAKKVIINGHVDGDVFGEESVAIQKAGNVKGNIITKSISIEDGARFHGSVDMDVTKISSVSKNDEALLDSFFADENIKLSEPVPSSKESRKNDSLLKNTSKDHDRLEKIAALSREKKKRSLAKQQKLADKASLQMSEKKGVSN